jgi:hypothetical protein
MFLQELAVIVTCEVRRRGEAKATTFQRSYPSDHHDNRSGLARNQCRRPFSIFVFGYRLGTIHWSDRTEIIPCNIVLQTFGRAA